MHILCLGAVYCDEEIRGSEMRGENVQSGSVIVTKTHLLGPKWTHLDKHGSYRNKVWFIAENAVLIKCYGCQQNKITSLHCN